MTAEGGFAELIAQPGARELSVFINCPFDGAYATQRDALVFSTVCCGLLPRVAMDLGQVSVPRMQRILDAIAACRYSIHDLTRCSGEGDLNLARFNMPLELGIAMAHKQLHDQEHDWLAMVPSGHAYVQFISDLAGYDPHQHEGTTESLVRVATAWLWTLPTAVQRHRPDAVCSTLSAYTAARQLLDVEFGGAPPWSAVYEAANRAVPP